MTASRSQIDILWAEKNQKDISQPYLQVVLENKTIAALPIKKAKEVLFIPHQRITPIPNMSDLILGLINQRSRIFWVVDLPYMLGMKPIPRNQQNYHVAIVRSNNIFLGLVVIEIKGIMRVTTEEIQSPIGNVAPSLVPYLQGCFWQKNKIILLLNVEAIVNSSLLKNIEQSTLL